MAASLGKMASADKFAVIKTIKAMKPIVEAFTDFRTDASEKLKGDNHAQMQTKAMQWQKEGDKCGLTDAEKMEVNSYFENYANDLKECIEEELQKDNELDIRTISEEAFGYLLDANDKWNADQIMKIQDIMCE